MVFDQEWQVGAFRPANFKDFQSTCLKGFVAKALCPELIFVPIDMAKYVAMSRRVIDILKQYDPTMLVAGCDEGYLKFCFSSTFDRMLY